VVLRKISGSQNSCRKADRNIAACRPSRKDCPWILNGFSFRWTQWRDCQHQRSRRTTKTKSTCSSVSVSNSSSLLLSDKPCGYCPPYNHVDRDDHGNGIPNRNGNPMGMRIDDKIVNGKEWETTCMGMRMALIPMAINSHRDWF